MDGELFRILLLADNGLLFSKSLGPTQKYDARRRPRFRPYQICTAAVILRDSSAPEITFNTTMPAKDGFQFQDRDTNFCTRCTSFVSRPWINWPSCAAGPCAPYGEDFINFKSVAISRPLLASAKERLCLGSA
jgi:hypothetical protein